MKSSWYAELKRSRKIFTAEDRVATKPPLPETVGVVQWSRWEVSAMDYFSLVIDYSGKEHFFWHSELEKA